MARKKIRIFWRLFPRALTSPMYWKYSIMRNSQTQKGGFLQTMWEGWSREGGNEAVVSCENAFPDFRGVQDFSVEKKWNSPTYMLLISGFYYNWYWLVNTSLKSHGDFHKDHRQKNCCFPVYILVLSLQIRTWWLTWRIVSISIKE